MTKTFSRLCAAIAVLALLFPALVTDVHAAVYSWPLNEDLTYITSYAGNRVHPLTGKKQNHSGIDIRAEKGSSVYATADGVAYIGCDSCSHNYGKSRSCGCGGGYGNYVYIVHDNGMVSYYAHLTRITVSDGERVKQGSRIATSGSTGSSTGFHLHFELRTSTDRDDRVDPLDYVAIPGQGSEIVIPEENNTASSPSVVEYYTGFASAPEQTKEPDNVYDGFVSDETPSASSSSIRIAMTQYPNTLKSGSSYNLKGTISSSYALTRVMGRILSADGSNVQTVAVYPAEGSLNVAKSDLNRNLRFGSLPVGSYTLLIEAADKNGGSNSWSESFTVGGGNVTSETSSSLKIRMTRYPTSLDRGDSFSLRGTISSDSRIHSIKGSIVDANGNVLQSTTDSPNAKSVDVKSENLNRKLAFGKLSKGTYILKITATDAAGNSTVWEKSFTVD